MVLLWKTPTLRENIASFLKEKVCRIYTTIGNAILPEQQRIYIDMCMVIWSPWTCRCHRQRIRYKMKRDLTKYKFTLHQMVPNAKQTLILIIKSHWHKTTRSHTHIRYFPLCISSGAFWTTRGAIWDVALTSAWFHRPGNGSSCGPPMFQPGRLD